MSKRTSLDRIMELSAIEELYDVNLHPNDIEKMDAHLGAILLEFDLNLM